MFWIEAKSKRDKIEASIFAIIFCGMIVASLIFLMFDKSNREKSFREMNVMLAGLSLYTTESGEVVISNLRNDSIYKVKISPAAKHEFENKLRHKTDQNTNIHHHLRYRIKCIYQNKIVDVHFGVRAVDAAVNFFIPNKFMNDPSAAEDVFVNWELKPAFFQLQHLTGGP